eukprot:13047092-Alexandrium_andersonii.AAC.1
MGACQALGSARWPPWTATGSRVRAPTTEGRPAGRSARKATRTCALRLGRPCTSEQSRIRRTPHP